MTPLKHVMILASAGSGKTYALTNRFVELLAAGAAPDRIVALTFTRKAAGEFFDEILRKLARAARDDAAAQRLANDLGRPDLGRADFLRYLRAMIDAMHRLRLGTLDSFFARIARAFPLELGLAGDFEVLQEHAARVERQRVLARMFARNGAGPDAAQAEFIEAFKRATFGTEEKRLGARLDEFLDAHQENYLAAPDQTVWGDPARIWPGGSRWISAAVPLRDAIRELRGLLGSLTDGQKARWEAFFAALEEWTPGAPLADAMEYILTNTLKVWHHLCDGSAEITIDRRRLPLPAGACRALEQIVTQIVGAELQRRIEMTRGIFAVLRSYDAHYHATVRRAGRLTFSDVQRLLMPVTLSRARSDEERRRGANEAESERSGESQLELGSTGLTDVAPSSLTFDPRPSADEQRLLLDYRLDAEIDHWLLDEFQDTSHGQWSVLQNLIDEVVQDPEGRRSFFCVGDVKQAIYAWREGDPRLFREIFQHYNRAAPGAIEERHLDQSWRSGPPIVAMVNAIFGAAPAISALFPGDASTTWNREWRDHASAVPDRQGQAALLHAADESERWATVVRLLREIRPLERGLTCAVLVKKNDTAAALADFLRRSALPALAESDLRIATDNPLGVALLALVQAAAHPADTLAREHVAMTPLAQVLADAGLATPELLTERLLGQIHAEGFERTLEYWVGRLEPLLAPDDAFSRQRAREFIAAAGFFDATGSRHPDEFVAFMERHTVRGPESGAVIRVMTIHKSKGLGFDVVLLPDLEGKRIDERRGGLAVQKAADRSIDWILDLPPRLFCSEDEVLAGYLRSAEAEACYESLSLLYVALTRAKRAMYAITEPVGKSTSRNFPRLLADTLGSETGAIRVGEAAFSGAWSSGASDWFAAIAATPAPDTVPSSLQPVSGGTGRARHPARRPSQRAEVLPARLLFALDAAAAADFGTRLHAALALVEWASSGDRTRWTRRWEEAGFARDVVTVASACLETPALASVWARPAGTAEVWRERTFEIVLDGAWLTGVFDRVVVERGADGAAWRAALFDFKTDRVAGAALAAAARRYEEQMRVYRRAVARLTGLPEANVVAALVFTAVGRQVPVG